MNLLADMGVQPATLQAGLAAASASTDTAAPSVDDHIPDRRRQGRGRQRRSRSAARRPTRGGGRRSAGSRSRSTAARPGTRRQGAANWTYTWTPSATGQATIQTRAVDDSGNLEIARAPAPRVERRLRQACPCSIWNDCRHRPRSTNDTSAVELGVKFRSDVAGYITGIRFYKGPDNTGTHVGHLWTGRRHAARRGDLHRRDRLRLAAGRLRRPGRDHGQHDLRRLLPRAERRLRRRPTATSPARASTARRCTRSPTASTAPTASTSTAPRASSRRDTFNASNYWVDVVFDDDVGTGHDAAHDQLDARRHSGASGVDAGANVDRDASTSRWTPATINGDDVRAPRPSERARCRRRSPMTPASRTATLDPADRARALDHLHGDASRAAPAGVKDVAGNALAADYIWSFTTAAPPPPPPDEGPGGPILVIAQRQRPVQPLLRGDPAGRGPERVQRHGHSAASPRPCSTPTTS